VLRPTRLTIACALASLTLAAVPLAAQQAPALRWGGDAEGGAPYVEADPSDPQKLVGFDVEIAEMIARELGRTPQFIQVAFASLDQSAARGDFDIGLSGIEDTPGRRAAVATAFLLPLSGSPSRFARAIAGNTARSRICEPSRLHAERHHRLRALLAERAHGITASPTTMTCIPMKMC
jgi:ABC-type amino acid transport substrate-binding protein